MNRRELFKGLAAALVVANIPLPIEQLIEAPQSELLRYLTRAKQDILSKLINPPIVVNRHGVVIYSAVSQDITDNLKLALGHIDRLIQELS